MLATWAAGVIRKWFYGWQARKLARQMRFLRRAERAVVVIQAFVRGWLVRDNGPGRGREEVVHESFRLEFTFLWPPGATNGAGMAGTEGGWKGQSLSSRSTAEDGG